MHRTATFEILGPDSYRQIQASKLEGTTYSAETCFGEPEGLLAILERYADARLHARIEYGRLHIGTYSEVWAVTGVPHCGNRYVKGFLQRLGLDAEVWHLTETDDPMVVPIRNPINVLMSWYKRSPGPLETEKLDLFFQQWAKLDEFLPKYPDAYIWHLDRESPASFAERLGYPVPEDPDRENHWMNDEWFTLKNPSSELLELADKWGYA